MESDLPTADFDGNNFSVIFFNAYVAKNIGIYYFYLSPSRREMENDKRFSQFPPAASHNLI